MDILKNLVLVVKVVKKTPINISGSLTLPYINKCMKEDKCDNIYNNLMGDCKEELDPNNPDPVCCLQVNNYYPIYDICYEQYKLGIDLSKGVEYGKNLLKDNYDICNK
jgi:hypothetical protein